MPPRLRTPDLESSVPSGAPTVLSPLRLILHLHALAFVSLLLAGCGGGASPIPPRATSHTDPMISSPIESSTGPNVGKSSRTCSRRWSVPPMIRPGRLDSGCDGRMFVPLPSRRAPSSNWRCFPSKRIPTIRRRPSSSSRSERCPSAFLFVERRRQRSTPLPSRLDCSRSTPNSRPIFSMPSTFRCAPSARSPDGPD